MTESIASPIVEDRSRRTSLYVTGAIVVAFLIVSIVFAAESPWYFVFKMIHVGAAVTWVGGGLFITMCAVLAELANDDDQLLQIGHWAENVAGRLFPGGDRNPVPRTGVEAAEQGRGRARAEGAGSAGEAAPDPARRPRRRGADVPDRL